MKIYLIYKFSKNIYMCKSVRCVGEGAPSYGEVAPK